MTNRLELNWKLDGFVDEQRYYCSDVPIDLINLPAPKVVLVGDVRSYTDANVVKGATYYIRIGAVKNNIEKISNEIQIVAKANYLNLFFTTDNVVVFGDPAQLSADANQGGLTLGSLTQNKSNVFQLTDSPSIKNFIATFDFTRLVGSGADAGLGLMFRTSNWSSNGMATAGILVAFSSTRVIFLLGNNSQSGSESELPSVSRTFTLNRKYSAKIEMIESTLKVYIDNSLVATRTVDVLNTGAFGFRSYSSTSGISMKIENLQITEYL